ncbi:MAG: glycosyltransferase family 9 protein [Gemmatimonadota bacterium]
MRSRLKRLAALIADGLLSAVGPALWPRIPTRALPSSPRVLLIRCDHIGDAAMATAVLPYLREVLEPEVIDVLAGPWAAALFASRAEVDRVMSYAAPWWSSARGAGVIDRVRQWVRLPGVIRQIRAGRYDVGIDLRGDLRQIVFFLGLGGIPIRAGTDRTGGRSVLTHAWPFDAARHDVDKNFAMIAMLAGASEKAAVRVRRNPHDVRIPAEPPPMLRERLAQPSESLRYMVLAMRGSAPNRAWPATHAAIVADGVREMGFSVVLVGSAADASFAKEVGDAARRSVIDLTGRTAISDLDAVFTGATATIAVDSGPMHLASAAGCPVIALFGPGDARTCGPWSDRTMVLRSDVPCVCRNPQCDFTSGPGRCMRSIEPEAVLTAVRQIVR